MRQALVAFGLDSGRIATAARRRTEVLGYLELHIEQGPVLEARHVPVGVVTAISGATRLSITLDGMAGHAGTVPMDQRRDALAGAAECILVVESYCRANGDLVGTVGQATVAPGATNVIPGRVAFTLDLRSAIDKQREAAVSELIVQFESIAKSRNLTCQIVRTHDNRSVPCAPFMAAQIAKAIEYEGYDVVELPSGAGHDGMAIVDIADIGMIFVRCRGGISHHPDEHAEAADVEVATRVLLRTIEAFKPA